MDSGDYYEVVSLDETGMYISFYNSGGSRVVRDFYVLAKSYELAPPTQEVVDLVEDSQAS